LSRLPVKNHTKDPRAAFSAYLLCFPIYFSHRYAPKNGQAISHINPNGQITIPKIGNTITEIINQILLPRTPRFVHPNFFVHRDGIT
jgi:hypothetical protein